MPSVVAAEQKIQLQWLNEIPLSYCLMLALHNISHMWYKMIIIHFTRGGAVLYARMQNIEDEWVPVDKTKSANCFVIRFSSSP